MARTMSDLGNRVWNDEEMSAFSGMENAKNYQNYKKQLEDDYDKNYSFGGNFLNWLGNGLSGGGWSKSDYLKNRGITDETDQYGNAGYFGNSSMGDLRNISSDYNKGRLEQLEAGKGLFSGVPLIGELLSTPAQVVSAGKDLAEGGLSKWQSGKRDWLSDVGALGETALDVATMGTASGAKTLGKTVGKGALLGAGYGLAGGLKDMGAKNFDLGQLAMNAGIGAGLGGGIAGAGYGLSKAWNKYSQPTPSKSTDIIPYSGGANTNSTAYQDALNTLKNAGIDTTSPETVNKGFKKFAVSNHPDKGGSTELFTKVNNAKTTYQDLLNNAGATATANAAPVANNLTFLQKLKNFGSNVPNMGKDIANTKAGAKVANLLKTKKGKIGAGIGGGLLLAQLMRNNNSNSGELSDEELQELYNYVYGGQ